MFKTAMKCRNVKFWMPIFIFSCMHLVQCKYLHRRIDDTDNTVQGKASLILPTNKQGHLLARADVEHKDTKDKDGESSPPDLDGESSAADAKLNDDIKPPTSETMDVDAESSDADAKNKDSKSSTPEMMDADGESSAQDKKDKVGESSAQDKKDKVGESSAQDKKDKVGESSDADKKDKVNNSTKKTSVEVLDNNEDNNASENGDEGNGQTGNCWFPIEAHAHFLEMDKLDEKYSEVRQEQSAASSKDFDRKMLEALLKTRGIAERALQHFDGNPNLIPAGLNLGGYCMLRMPQSVLFFHRMKLRNNTRFRVNYLQNDLSDMLVTLRFSLNDLHLHGDYERAVTYSSASTLYYTPTYGELEFLLRDVAYNVEGRYRLLNDRLYVEHIISELTPKAILMRYMKENNTASMTSIKLDYQNISPYLKRMQNDLDHWLKDYFNDFLIYLDLPETSVNPQNQAYENEKTVARNRFADNVIKGVRKRLRQVNASSIMIPDFKIYTVSEMEITLYDGIIRGLDTIHRRSVVTGKLDDKNIRHLDTIVGFSKLKVEYKYNMFLRTGLPPLFGMLVLDVDDLTGRLALQTVRDSPTLDMHFVLMAPYEKTQSLVVEGPANRYIAKYKNILEHQISSIMSSTMIHYMQQLDSLARCQTHLIGKDDPKYKTIDDSDSVETTNDPSQSVNVDPTEKALTDDDGDVTNSEPETVTDAPDDSKQKQDDPDTKLPEDYIVSRKESIELEFPKKDGDDKAEKMKVEVDEKFSLTRLNKGERRTG